EVIDEPSEPPKEDPRPVAPTKPPAAPESATPEGNQETPTEESPTQGIEPTAPPEDNLEKELRAAEKRVKYLQVQQRIKALEADIARSQRSIASSESLSEGARQRSQTALRDPQTTEDTSEPAASTSRNLTPTAFPVRTRSAPAADNYQYDSESENEYSNKPPTKKAISETYHGKTQRELQIGRAHV